MRNDFGRNRKPIIEISGMPFDLDGAEARFRNSGERITIRVGEHAVSRLRQYIRVEFPDHDIAG